MFGAKEFSEAGSPGGRIRCQFIILGNPPRALAIAIRSSCVILLINALLAGYSSALGQPAGIDETADQHRKRGHNVLAGQDHVRLPGMVPLPGRCYGDGLDSLESRFEEDRPELLTFELWPDMTEYSAAERYPAPGFPTRRPPGRALLVG